MKQIQNEFDKMNCKIDEQIMSMSVVIKDLSKTINTMLQKSKICEEQE